MAVRVLPPPGAAELVGRRTRHAKVFRFTADPRKHQVVVGVTPLHWQDGANMADVDLEWEFFPGPGVYRVRSTSYRCEFDPATYILKYESRTSGDLRLRLQSIAGVAPVVVATQISPDGDTIRYQNIVAGVSLQIVARAEGVEIFRHFVGPTRPVLVWQFDESVSLGAIITNVLEMEGRDNYNLNSSARNSETLPTNKRRVVEIDTIKGSETITNGRRQYTFSEQMTGRTRWVDTTTRVPEWRAAGQFVFPVRVDVLVSEVTTATADDGEGYAGTWYNNVIAMNVVLAPGWRFQTVDIPQGATIDDAILRVNVVTDATRSGPLAGNDVDNAPVWASSAGNVPQSMTPTAATVAFGNFGGTGDKDIPITAIVQEIVDRPGFAGGSMRFGALSGNDGADTITFTDYNASPSNAGRLIANYTAAGGAGHPTARRHGGIPGMRSTPRFGRSW